MGGPDVGVSSGMASAGILSAGRGPQLLRIILYEKSKDTGEEI